jgi:hypothetical protein
MKRLDIELKITGLLPEGRYMEDVVLEIELLLQRLGCEDGDVDLRAMNGLELKATSWL